MIFDKHLRSEKLLNKRFGLSLESFSSDRNDLMRSLPVRKLLDRSRSTH